MLIDLTLNIANDHAILIAEALGMEMIDPVTGEPFADIEAKTEAFIERNLYDETVLKYGDIVRQIWVVEVNKSPDEPPNAQQQNDVAHIMGGMVKTNNLGA